MLFLYFPHMSLVSIWLLVSTIDMSVRNPTCRQEHICLREVNILKAFCPTLSLDSNTKQRKMFLAETNIDMVVPRKDV